MTCDNLDGRLEAQNKTWEHLSTSSHVQSTTTPNLRSAGHTGSQAHTSFTHITLRARIQEQDECGRLSAGLYHGRMIPWSDWHSTQTPNIRIPMVIHQHSGGGSEADSPCLEALKPRNTHLTPS